MAEKPDIKKKEKEKKKETKKPCHRRTIRTYLYAAWPTVPGVAVMKAVNYGTSSPSPRRQGNGVQGTYMLAQGTTLTPLDRCMGA